MHQKIGTLFLVTLFVASLTTVTITQPEKQSPEDVFRELETGELAFYFLNALDGGPLTEADVTIAGTGSFKTDFSGKVTFPIPPDGYYRVTFSKHGFVASTFKIEVMSGTLFFNRFSISPEMPLGMVRIVLDWGEKPRDLDAHLVKKDGYHISYRRKIVSQDGVAQLDRDDTDSFGPETITAKRIDADGEYEYFIHDYTHKKKKHSRALSGSKASVKVFGEKNRLLEVFQIPRNRVGTHWHVFSVKNGEVIRVNEISNDRSGETRLPEHFQ